MKKSNKKQFQKMTVKEQLKVMNKVAGLANKAQRDLIDRYDAKYGSGA